MGNWSWSALILPYVEETAVYSLINVSKTDLAKSMDSPPIWLRCNRLS